MKLVKLFIIKKNTFNIRILDTDGTLILIILWVQYRSINSIEDVCLWPEDDYELDNDPFENAETIDDL